MGDGAVSFNYSTYDGEWQEVEAEVIEEGQLTIFVNGIELAALMCTPRDPLQLALGFLANEELISGLEDVEIDYVCPEGGCVDLWLSYSILGRPVRKIITSGCSGGQTFSDLSAAHDPVQSELKISPDRIVSLLGQLQSRDSLYARARGVHASALSDGEKLVIIAEDIGRHNTLDRLRGECLRQEIDSRGMILLSTGRIS
jgi:FdhD protein